MTKRTALLLLCIVALNSCERKREPNKILDGNVAGTVQVVGPAEAARQYVLLKRDLLRTVLPVLNRMQTSNATFGDLTPVGGGQYSFQGNDPHYGTVTFTLGFQDANGGGIDPISVPGSSSSLKAVTVTGAGASTLFPTITENLTLAFESAGVFTTTLRLTGTSVFNGPTYTLTFTNSTPGSRVIFAALTSGTATATGSGGTPAAPATVNLEFSSDQHANGTITWEGQEGGIHLETNGSGFVVTTEGRILLE